MTTIHGDPALAARVGALLGSRHPVFAVGTTSTGSTGRNGSNGSTVLASVGAGPADDFEIGSVSKGITGLLYADALDRAEVARETRLGELLPLDDTEAGSVTLEAISTHRSGLPSLPRSAAPVRRTLALWRHGTSPYGETLEELLVQARTVHMGSPKVRYSNLGFQLLGHALAAAAGTSYVELVRRRIAEPLGLTSLHAPATPDQLRATAVRGRSRTGRSRAPWTGEAIAPAGGLRASITDMLRLTATLLDGTAPGIRALDPTTPFSGSAVRIGAAWITLENAGREVTWHNGGTGGFRSWLGLDREAGTGVVLLSATSASVDRHGFALLADLTG